MQSGLILWVLGGLAVLPMGRRPRACGWISATTLLIGSVLMLPAVWNVLAGAPPLMVSYPWSVPGGEFALQVDALAAWFLLPTLGVAVLAAVFGIGYLNGRTPPSWFFFNLLAASMATVLMARNAVLFLTAWEVMALASFFLVTFDDEKETARRAGWIYLVATHLGTALLLAFFLIAARETGSLDFRDWAAVASFAPGLGSLMFVLALLGFGAKAGIIPLHVWLPEAHPAAPSHVSAVMSGVMIKTGIYGLLRALTFLGDTPPAWWGWTLLLVGVSSGILGVLYALAQHDLKRLLAYHSVENIGIICTGLGLGLLGQSLALPQLSILGFAGCLLHVLNHALFKSLLFLGAGSILKAARTLEIDQLGGLSKRMPWTAAFFLVGSVAICGLPPLNGFISELIIFVGGLSAILNGGTTGLLAGLVAVAGLALISGLAIACFTKAFGIAFLGEPRTEAVRNVEENELTLRIPMLLLAAACFVIGLGAPVVVASLTTVVSVVAGLPVPSVSQPIANLAGSLQKTVWVFALLAFLCTLLAVLRAWLLSGRTVETSVTWDCGYARPTARMQYTASSFARPITMLFGWMLKTETHGDLPAGLFPGRASLATQTADAFLDVYRRLFGTCTRLISALRWLQHGNIHLYVLYIALTLLGLLFWMTH